MSDPVVLSELIASWASPLDHAATQGRRTDRSLAARAALRALLARTTGRQDWILNRTANGKPFLQTADGAPGPAVSLSHSGTTIAVAIAPSGEVGIDVERHQPRDFGALAAQAFGPAERADVARLGEDAFYRIWTLREAMAKATGEGLALAANRQDLVSGDQPYADRVIRHANRAWRLAHLRIEPMCSLAVAQADPPQGPWALHWCDLLQDS